MSNDQRRMVPPQNVTVNATPPRVERGTGVNVQVEISQEAHEQMRLELMLRKRRGADSTMHGLMRELIEKARAGWPMPPTSD